MQVLQKSNKKFTSRYKLWLIQSAHDLGAARLSMDNGFYEWATYQAIQSAEKSLKAVIVRAGYRPPKTHGIAVLIGIANGVDKAFSKVRFDYRKIESYTFISRYPFVSPEIDLTPHELIKKEDALASISVAESILDNVEDYIRARLDDRTELDNAFTQSYFTLSDINRRVDEVVEKVLSVSLFETKKIVLFGSFARSKKIANTKSMDILIIANTEVDFFKRIYLLKEILRGGVPIIEPIVYTESEIQKMLEQEGEGFLESALEEGKIIWEVS